MSCTSGINRNIVECKDWTENHIQRTGQGVLIETSWNVKDKEKRI